MEHVNTRPRPFVTPEQSNTKVSGMLHSKCKRCKAPIEKPHKQWGWYIGDKDFCTYRCMRRWEQEQKKKKLRGENTYG